MIQPTFAPIADPNRLYGLQVESVSELRNAPRRVAPDILRLFVAAKVPIFLWGPVGARKTRSIEALSAESDENGTPYQVITIQPSTSDPTVIHGLMYTSLDPEDGSTVMLRSIPDVAKQIATYYEQNNGLTVLFLDEMTTCMPAQQHALLGLLTHGKYGDLDISPYISIALAANPEGTVSAVNPLGEQVLNRGGHIAWYGDKNLFIEEWTSGFNNPARKPDDDVAWMISTLLDQAPSKAFRSDRWEPDELVPWELLEHTERAVTDLSKVILLVNKTFEMSPDPIRHFYLHEVTKAMLGPEWSSYMGRVLQMESERIDYKTTMRKVNASGLTIDSTSDEMFDQLSDTLHWYEGRRGKQYISSDQALEIVTDLKSNLGNKPNINKQVLLSLWAFVSTIPNTTTVLRSVIPDVLEVMASLGQLIETGDLAKRELMPKFVTKDVKEAIAEVYRE